MSFDFDMPENIEAGGGLYLKEPGTYHLSCNKVDEQPTNKEGQLMDGIQFEFSVLAGTTDGQVDKLFETTLFQPKLSNKDGGEFAKKKMARLFVALGLVKPTQRGKSVSIDLQSAVGRQCIATLAMGGKDNKFLDINYADVWHVDDPAAKNFPKNQDALKLVPAANRLKAADFLIEKPASNGAGRAPVASGGVPVTTSDLGSL